MRLPVVMGLIALPSLAGGQAKARLLGVYDVESGAPISGAQVSVLQTGVGATTNSSGLVSLSFLPDGGALVRIRKVGYAPVTRFLAVSPGDTTPVTEVLSPSTVTLPAVTTRDSSPKYISPALRGFEQRRHAGFGHFITEAELRKSDEMAFENVAARMPGLVVSCKYVRAAHGRGEVDAGTACFATSVRSGCQLAVYLDGIPQSGVMERDLAKMKTRDFGAVEFYEGASETPPEFNATGSACGVLLLWTRER